MTVEEALASIAAAGTARVGPVTTLDPNAPTHGALGLRYHVVLENPQTLADAAGLSLDEYALARMVSSEYGGAKHSEVMLGAAECAVNHAAYIGKTVAQSLLLSSIAASNSSGKFGENACGKWASTAQDPNETHVAAAKAALSGTNFALGARDFIEPGGQNVGDTQGSTVIQTSAAAYIAKNEAAGLFWVGNLPNINPSQLMMFADKSKLPVGDQNQAGNTDAALAVLAHTSTVAFLIFLGTVAVAWSLA